jgi:hypothetical protein
LNPRSYRRAFQKYILSRVSPPRANSQAPFEPTNTIREKAYSKFRQFRFSFISGYYSQLMKSNSTSAFALLEFYRTTGKQIWEESLSQWCESALNVFCTDGKVFREYYPTIDQRSVLSVTPAFILSDVICDVAWWIPTYKQYLPKIKQILSYQWDQRMANGLIPVYEGADFAHLDNQIDLAISFRKYAELSADTKFLERSQELTMRAIALHYSPDGYLTYSGEVPRKIIDPKYNGLLLKGMINLLTIEQPSYPKLVDLFKDR